MLIIGCYYHPSVQQIAFADTETRDYGERRLKHSDGEAGKFYRDLKLRGSKCKTWAGSNGTYAMGLSDCFRNWVGSFGSAMRLRLPLCESGNRRPTVKMPSSC